MALLAPAIWAADVRRAAARRTSRDIRVDGILNEDVWCEKGHIGGFVQADPHPGRPPTERTELRIAFDNQALCVALCCFDESPETIFFKIMARDKKPWDDDSIEITIDPFHDRRTVKPSCGSPPFPYGQSQRNSSTTALRRRHSGELPDSPPTARVGPRRTKVGRRSERCGLARRRPAEFLAPLFVPSDVFRAEQDGW